ncbi:hypothetical protein EDB80DRAFT_627844 [Ilyonectria destructans]|nr:hypothetical protein EDB80DRAFT_627844 [Ilyonectria destructans]
MFNSIVRRLKGGVTRKPPSSKAEDGLSRCDAKGVNTARKPNPFLDPLLAAHPVNETPNEAPPAYTEASIASAEDRYAFLSTFDTVFVIDDSGSMAGRSWYEVREALSAIAPICTSHDPDGIDVYFLNHKSGAAGSAHRAPNGYTNIRDPAQVQRLFESARPSGSTPTGTRLQSILEPYLASITRRPDSMNTVKPVNIIIITDGAPTDDPERVIIEYARSLDEIKAPPHQVGIQFFQVGTEFEATEALKGLDNDLSKLGIRDMVDTTLWSESLSADGILKVVLGAVVRRLDRKP